MARPKSTKPKPLGKNTTEDKNSYRKLTDYLQEVYVETVGYDPPWQLFMTQIKDIVKNYNIDYDQILLVLKYMVQIEGINLTDRDTLGLVPYYINKTEKYLAEYAEARKAIKEFKRDEKIITIKSSNQNKRPHKKNEVFD